MRKVDAGRTGATRTRTSRRASWKKGSSKRGLARAETAGCTAALTSCGEVDAVGGLDALVRR